MRLKRRLAAPSGRWTVRLAVNLLIIERRQQSPHDQEAKGQSQKRMCIVDADNGLCREITRR